MTLTQILATAFVSGPCDLCGQLDLLYPDPETGGRICLTCLEFLSEPLDDGPPDPTIMEIAAQIFAARRATRNEIRDA